ARECPPPPGVPGSALPAARWRRRRPLPTPGVPLSEDILPPAGVPPPLRHHLAWYGGGVPGTGGRPVSETVFARRLEALRARFEDLDIDGFLTFHGPNRRYLSGFTGSAGYVLVTARHAVLLTDSRYTEQARQQAPDFEVIQHGDEVWDALSQQVRRAGVKHLGFEPEDPDTTRMYHSHAKHAYDVVRCNEHNSIKRRGRKR